MIMGIKDRRLKRKRQKVRARERKQRLDNFAIKLNDHLPKSEIWFSIKSKDFIGRTFDCNSPFGPFIPDLIDHTSKIIIEVDGSIHETIYQQRKDRIKDKYYRSRGYKVFRVKAFCNKSFDNFKKKYFNFKGTNVNSLRKVTLTDEERKEIEDRYNLKPTSL